MRNAVGCKDEVDDVARDGLDGVGSKGKTVFAYLDVEGILVRKQGEASRSDRRGTEGERERHERRGRKWELREGEW